mgnify:CR=1 FL=1
MDLTKHTVWSKVGGNHFDTWYINIMAQIIKMMDQQCYFGGIMDYCSKSVGILMASGWNYEGVLDEVKWYLDGVEIPTPLTKAAKV